MQPTPEEFSRIADVAADTLGVRAAAIKQVSRLKGGLTNESWHAVSAAGDVVVRISTADEVALQINRISECRVLAVVDEAGLGPQVLRCDPAQRVLVTRFIPGTSWNQDDARVPGSIVRLAGLLKRLHSLECDAGIAVTDLPAILRHYWATLSEQRLPDPPGPWTRDVMLRFAESLSQEAGHCLCHNDVHPLNLLDTGRLWLIDWEYAGIGSPWFDLASACCNHGYDETQRQHLLRHYLGFDDSPAAARLKAACTLFDYIRQLWLAVRGE